jgi:hypothetical protein
METLVNIFKIKSRKLYFRYCPLYCSYLHYDWLLIPLRRC